MGIYDRDYMKGRRDEASDQAGAGGWRWLWIVVGVLVVIGIIASIQYKRGARPLAEGSQVVNINTATARELESLPGIGPAKAQLIILGRPYAKVDDLSRVRGISARQVEQLRSMLTVSEPTRNRQPKSIWQHMIEWGQDVGGIRILGYSLGTLIAVYFIVPWVRRMWERNRTARTQRLFEEAERRRWEGHKRE